MVFISGIILIGELLLEMKEIKGAACGKGTEGSVTAGSIHAVLYLPKYSWWLFDVAFSLGFAHVLWQCIVTWVTCDRSTGIPAPGDTCQGKPHPGSLPGVTVRVVSGRKSP